MKLSFIDITDSSKKPDIDWSYYSNSELKPRQYYLGSNIVNQRIQIRYGKIGNNFKDYSEMMESTLIHKISDTGNGIQIKEAKYSDELPLSIGTNAKNLNPFIHVGEGSPGRNDVNMVVLTVGRGVSYIRSLAHDEVQIINTFREHDETEYKGCCVVYHEKLHESAANTESGYIPLLKFDGMCDGILMHYEIALGTDGNISVISSEIKYTNLKSKLMSIYENTNKRRGFIAKCDNAGVLSPNMNLVYGEIPMITSDDISQKELDDTFSAKRKEIVSDMKGNYYRTVILRNLKLPKDIIAELKLLYIFTVDETGKIRTVKSN